MAGVLGDGIYSGNDPSRFFRFRRDATEGMMILRLVGHAGKHPNELQSDTMLSPSTGIVNLRRSD